MNPKNPSNKKRVLMLLTNAFEPDPRVHQEAKALVENGYDVTILCWDREYRAPAYEIIDGIKIERIYVHSTHGRGSSQAFFLLLFWLKAYLRATSKRFDVVHCHDFDTLPLGYFLAKPKRSKIVYDAHESYVDMLENLPPLLKKFIYVSENFFLRQADLLITVGEILKGAFEERGAKRTCVVGNWKDPEQFKFSKEVLEVEKRNLGILNGQLVVSFIANLGKERQLSQLIRAVANSPRVFLVIGGDGACREVAYDASQRYPNVSYLGSVAPSKVPLYTAISDIVFYGFDLKNPNSKYSSPNKLFEALAAGKAILTGDFGEIGEIVRKNQCGCILKDYTSTEIALALSNFTTEILSKQQEYSRQTAEGRYNWRKASLNLISSYQNILG